MGRRNQTAAATRTTTSDEDDVVIVRDDEADHGGQFTDEQVADALGTDTTGGQASSAEGAAPAKPKRKRGPNKPKPNLFTVQTDANMAQAQIVALLTAAAEQHLGKDAAAGMELQVNVGGGWEPVSANGADVRFATKGHK